MQPDFEVYEGWQMKTNHKQLKQEYRQAVRPMGVFQIRNLANGKIFVVAGINLEGIINRHKFALRAGAHQNQQLQLDWNSRGAESFAFEILDQLNPAEDRLASRKDLETLEDMWLKKLRPYAERGYNQPKTTRAEMLKRMAAQRANEG